MLRSALCLSLLALPAFAQDKAELCRVSSEIAGSAVSERVAGVAQDDAATAITAELQENAAQYAAAVQPIVAWVYALPEEQLTDEVATSYAAACLAQ